MYKAVFSILMVLLTSDHRISPKGQMHFNALPTKIIPFTNLCSFAAGYLALYETVENYNIIVALVVP